MKSLLKASLQRINYVWRVFATGLSFTLFGVGGLLLRLLCFPLLQCFIPAGERRRKITRRWVQLSFMLFMRIMRVLGVLEWEFHNLERLQRQGLLVLANHPTLIDVVALYSLMPNASCLVKPEAARNPFYRGPVRACGFIPNDGSAALIDGCIAALKQGDNLIIFPEGTRSVPGEPLRLRRGAARVALRGGFAITPVRIRCTPPTLSKGQKWYRIAATRVRLSVDVGADIPIELFCPPGSNEPESLVARKITEYLTIYFSGSALHASTRTGNQTAHHLFLGTR